MSAPNKHQSDAIHRSINEALARIESESIAQALDQHEDVQTPSSLPNPSVATALPPQLKRSRETVPLDLLPVKEARITQFNMATQSVPPDRPAHQRQVKGTSFFGDLIQPNSVQHLATSSLVGPSQARSRARSSGLATNTRPGRSGEDTRPGMTSGPQRKDFLIVPVSRKSSKANVTSLQSTNVNVTSPPQQHSTLVPALELSSARVVPQVCF